MLSMGRLNPDDIDEDALSARMLTANVPDPDLIIRTGGEARLSNFLLWQSSYAELVVQDGLWPDFDADALHRALQEYEQRPRRLGGTTSHSSGRAWMTLNEIVPRSDRQNHLSGVLSTASPPHPEQGLLRAAPWTSSAKARKAGVSTAARATLNPITWPSVSPGSERTRDSNADFEAAYAGIQEMGHGWQSWRWKSLARVNLDQGSLQLAGEIQWGNGIDFKYLTVEIRIGLFDGNVWGVSGVVDDRSDASGPLGQLGPKSHPTQGPPKGCGPFPGTIAAAHSCDQSHKSENDPRVWPPEIVQYRLKHL